MAETPRFFRPTRGTEEQHATALELFFDLVFVFAVTQLSHLLLTHLTWSGLGQTAFLLVTVWWAWGYTTWMTNWFDPDAVVVRLLLIAITLASLFMAIAIPHAFGGRALMFALSYTAIQVMRNAFVVWALDRGSMLRDTFDRILVWSVVVGVILVAGAFLDGGGRVALWLLAIGIDLSGPAAGYWLPGKGRALTTDWEVDASHFTERFQLFIIIALGESIVVTGATASGFDITAARAFAIAIAFLGSAALWWLYFDYVARIAAVRLELAGDNRGGLARDAFTYIHLLLVAGIIVAAVGDELLIVHPGAELSAAQLAALAGGPALYLLGHVLFRLRMAGSLSVKRLATALVIVAIGALGAVLPALVTAGLIVLALVVLIAAEIEVARRRRARGEPSPIDRLREQASANAGS